ncbi:SusC/RagA family TonB-linked outer membrane protein [Larkinella arboricola]
MRVHLPHLLKEITKRYQVEFNYNYRQLNQKMVDSRAIDQKHQPIEALLTEVLVPLDLTFEKASDRSYLIYPKSPLKNAPVVPAQSILPASAPERTPSSTRETAPEDKPVSGVVKDERGNELPGVSVVIKGTTRGTSTNQNGAFQLAVPNDQTVLVFSFVGYLKKEVTVGNQSVINLTMAPDDQALDEVVVVGYGTQKKANMTGAVSTVDSKDIENRPVPNVALALQGLSPGLSITRTTGQPGDEGGIGIQVRGASSANGNVAPLLVVDGVTTPGATLMSLNPADIETISVLKDAAAAAIYGAQAAGGVILVTTKKGKQGKTVFEFSSMAGIDWALNVPERLPTWEELTFNNMARINSGAAAGYSDETIAILKEGKITHRVNPNDSTRYQYFGTESIVNQMLRKNTYMQTHNISARGGTDKLNFMISAGYYDKQGVFRVGPDKNDRYNVRVNLGTQLTRHLSLDSRITYTLQRQEAAPLNLNGNGALLYNIYRYSSSNPLRTPEGRYTAGHGATAYAIMDGGGYNNYKRNFFDGVFTARVTNLAKGLEIRGVYGAQYRRGDRQLFERTVERWYRTVGGDFLNTPNRYTVSNDMTVNNNLQFLVDYDFSIGTKHRFHVLGGYQWEDSRTERISTGVTALSSNDLPALGLGDENSKTNSQDILTYAFQSYFGRFNYNFADKYLFEATFRVDESSRLAPHLRRKSFPSLSAGWNLHRESWFQVPVVSELKLRGSWGRLGAASGIGLYDYLALLSRNSALVLGSPEVKTNYFGQTAVPSSQLSWETI